MFVVSVCLPSDALSQRLPSYLGFSCLGCGVPLHGCSSQAQPLFLTLDVGYLLLVAAPDLVREVALHSCSCAQLPLHSRSWWCTGGPGVLLFVGSQRVRRDWATELNWDHWVKLIICFSVIFFLVLLAFRSSTLLSSLCFHVSFFCFVFSFLWSPNSQNWFFPGGSDSKQSACNAGDPSLIHGLRRSPGEADGYQLQYSCLENSKDRGAWQASSWGRKDSDTTWLSFIISFHSFPNSHVWVWELDHKEG